MIDSDRNCPIRTRELALAYPWLGSRSEMKPRQRQAEEGVRRPNEDDDLCWAQLRGGQDNVARKPIANRQKLNSMMPSS